MNFIFKQVDYFKKIRLTRDDFIKICGLPEGIRMFNAIHNKLIVPHLTIYVTIDNSVYYAIYLYSVNVKELLEKLHQVPGFISPPGSPLNLESKPPGSETNLPDIVSSGIFLLGPSNVQIVLTDQVLGYVKDGTLFNLQTQNTKIILRPESERPLVP